MTSGVWRNIRLGILELTHRIRSILKTKLKDVHLKELLVGSSTSFVFKVFGFATNYMFILIVTRSLGAETMGIFALSLTLVQIFSVIGRLGLDSALLRFVSEYYAQNRKDMVKEVYIKAINVVIPISLALAIFLFIFSKYISGYVFNGEHLSVYFKIASFAIMPLVLITVNSECLRGLKKIKEYSFLQTGSVFLFAAFILAVSMNFTTEKYMPLVAYIISLFFVAILSFVMWLNDSEFMFVPSGGSIKMGTILDVALPMLFTTSLVMVLQWADTIMLGMFKSEAEIGVYNVAVKVSMLTGIVLFSINSIAAPKFAEFYGRQDIKGIGRLSQQSTRLIFWCSLPILTTFFLFPSLVLGLFGEEFKGGIYALMLLAAGQFINAISGSVGYILQMTGKQRVHQNIMLIATAINIALNALLIPTYGINGAAFASMISITFWNLSAVFYIKMSYGIFPMYMPLSNKLLKMKIK